MKNIASLQKLTLIAAGTCFAWFMLRIFSLHRQKFSVKSLQSKPSRCKFFIHAGLTLPSRSPL